MSYATEPLMENAQRQSDFILIALLISIGLHSTAICFLPGFGKPPAPITPEPLTVELVTPEAPPPPPPIKEPEPAKPDTAGNIMKQQGAVEVIDKEFGSVNE